MSTVVLLPARATDVLDIAVDIADHRAKLYRQRFVHEVDLAVGDMNQGRADYPGFTFGEIFITSRPFPPTSCFQTFWALIEPSFLI